MKRVKAKGIPVLVYEPTMADEEFFGSEVTHDLESFKERADVIVANRWSDELSDVGDYLGICSGGTRAAMHDAHPIIMGD